MNNKQLNEHFKAIKHELSYAEKKHPKFCDCFDSLMGSCYKDIVEKMLTQVRCINDSLTEANNIGAIQILQEEITEAMLAYAEGDLPHCLQELAQCEAVILRTMEFVKNEMEKESVLANKDKEIEDLKNLHYVDMMDLDMENYKLKEQLRKYKRKRAELVAIVCYRKFAASTKIKEEVFWMKWHNYWADIADKLKEKK